MLNVGGDARRQGPLVRDCIQQVSTATGEKSMAPCNKTTNYVYLSSSSCANVIQCGKVKVPCKFK